MRHGTRLGVCVGGTVIVAICCFTPALVIILGVVGLSAWLAWLDYVLLPMLGVFVVFTVIAFIGWKRSRSGAGISSMME